MFILSFLIAHFEYNGQLKGHLSYPFYIKVQVSDEECSGEKKILLIWESF